MNIREVRLSAGAIMTMSALSRVPAANNIYLNEDGQVEGLF